MTVQDIFALRKQGKIEEAYEAIRPIYKEHKGRFTTLCMFWTATDVFKLRLEQKRVEEAEKIFRALERLVPSIEDDRDGKVKGFMHYAESRLIHASEKFRKRYFAIHRKEKKASLGEGINIPSNNPSKDSSEVQKDVQPAASICDIRDICVTDKLAAGYVSAISALSAGQKKVLDCIKAHPGLKVPGIKAETGIPAKSIERHIKVLIARNLIEHRGSKKTGGYHALDSTFGRLLP